MYNFLVQGFAESLGGKAPMGTSSEAHYSKAKQKDSMEQDLEYCTRGLSFLLLQDCLKDLRTRLVDMANIIQGRFEHETEKLQMKQAWYKSMQGSLTKEEEGDYVTFCNDTMFTIHILEQRLNRCLSIQGFLHVTMALPLAFRVSCF